MIPVYKPYLPKGALKEAHDALASTWLSSSGKWLDRTKELLSEYWGTEYIILTNSGTAAVHLAALAAKKRFSEQYTDMRYVAAPNNVYVAAWNMFVLAGYEIGTYDANIETWNTDYVGYQPYRGNALLVVHNLGNMVDVPKLRTQFEGVPIIEDACEAFGGYYEDENGTAVPAGTKSDAFAMSFFGNKNVTSGEGGAFVTYDEEMYLHAYRYWGQGMEYKAREKFIHDYMGHNYRMTNVQAAILHGQLRLFGEILEMKWNMFEEYKKRLRHLPVIFQKETPHTRHSNWMFGIRIPGSNYYMAKKHFDMYYIDTRPMFYPITAHRHLEKFHRGKHDVAEKLNDEVVILPSYAFIGSHQLDYICKAVEDYVRELEVLQLVR